MRAGPWWLGRWAIFAAVVIGCAPFLLTRIPPLVDIPGHIAALAVDLAPPESPLHRYFGWHWVFTLNMGGEVLMRLLAFVMPPISAGWTVTVLATGALVAGTMVLARTLNRDGAFGAPLALMFVFGLPWTWGFLNYLLALGFAFLAFGLSDRLAGRPALRAAFLVVAQPALLLCHAIGGLVLPILVAASAFGRALDEGRPLTETIRATVRECWPLAATLVVVVMWKLYAPPATTPGLRWVWNEKLTFLAWALRDQHLMLDLFSAFAAYFVALAGLAVGARYAWRQGLPVVALWAFYLLLPTDINGSEFVDTRTLMAAMIATLALQDWGRVDRGLGRIVLLFGALLLAVRVAVLTLSFADYRTAYREELGAVNHIARGSKVLVLNEMCWQPHWRHDRISMLPTMAIPLREAWVNHGWTIPGIHMLQLKFDPAPGRTGIRNFGVRSPPCRKPEHHLPQVLASAPVEQVDYLWLSNTGPLPRPDPRLRLIWHRDQRSFLYRVISSPPH